MTSPTDDGPQAARLGGREAPKASIGSILIVVAALVAISLVILSLVMANNVSNRVDTLEDQIPVLSSDDSQVVNALLELRVLTYWLAYPTTQPLLLEPSSGTGGSQGVLRIADDGLSGIMMVAGMQELPPPSVYQVWLTGDNGDQVLAGQMTVDPSGWGATTIYLQEPISDFDNVAVTVPTADGLGLTPGTRILEAAITNDAG